MTRPSYLTPREQSALRLPCPGRHYAERRSVYAITPLDAGGTSMRVQYHFIALALTLSPIPATADPIAWQRYAVPSNHNFHRRCWKPDNGVWAALSDFGRASRFDGAVCSKRRRRLSGCVSCKNEPTLEHRVQESDAPVLCSVWLSQRKNLVQPL